MWSDDKGYDPWLAGKVDPGFCAAAAGGHAVSAAVQSGGRDDRGPVPGRDGFSRRGRDRFDQLPCAGLLHGRVRGLLHSGGAALRGAGGEPHARICGQRDHPVRRICGGNHGADRLLLPRYPDDDEYAAGLLRGSLPLYCGDICRHPVHDSLQSAVRLSAFAGRQQDAAVFPGAIFAAERCAGPCADPCV